MIFALAPLLWAGACNGDSGESDTETESTSSGGEATSDASTTGGSDTTDGTTEGTTSAGTTTTGTTGTTSETTGTSETTDDSTTAADPVCAEALGLYTDADCEVLDVGVASFTPHYKLWSDGVVKSRFVYLPPGETVDVSDPDGWVFPVGTIFWKHFASDSGQLLETRRIEKTADQKGPDGWTFSTFVWNEAGDDVTAVEDGANNVLGTDHDIPSVDDCSECHSGGDNGMMMGGVDPDELLDAALGFSAIQLNHADSETTLTSLSDDGWLNGAISTSDAVIPGDATAEAAIGYLHANCGHCHGGAAPAKNMTLWVDVGTPTVEGTTTYQNTVMQPADMMPMGMGLEDMPDWRVLPGDPDNSAIAWRMGKRTDDDAPMPPLATEIVDDAGLAAVEAWIVALGG